ncbi:hypothetical protein llap_17156 [Limosa lapponica baueri]|uniref:Uncharacterized protein n=1 Tax=Limosa lapponica baueri TaxID=1758121 RepID=A0A2I0TFH1_LIMLA|nr:hypothetical protein llap_17156 [Limosa lapponica baueri]
MEYICIFYREVLRNITKKEASMAKQHNNGGYLIKEGTFQNLEIVLEEKKKGEEEKKKEENDKTKQTKKKAKKKEF